MDPQLKSVLTTVLGAAFASVGTYAVSKGIIPAGDQATLVNDLVGATMYGGAALVAWYKTRRHAPEEVVKTLPQETIIRAVNESPNGLKVVADTSPGAKVSAPIQ